MYAFFQNCWYLKDWVINDTENILKNNDLNKFAEKHFELKIAGALCNSSKHLIITDNNFDGDVEISGRHYELGLGGFHPQINIKFRIIDKNELEHDAFGIATRCIKLWEDFFKKIN